MTRKPPEEWKDHGEPVSIPLDPKEALKALLKVKPEDEPAQADRDNTDS